MAHETKHGFPVDPEIRRLEHELGDLAAEWRGAQGEPEQRMAIVRAYHVTIAQLMDRGWDAGVANLGYEETLPDELMPAAYLQQVAYIPEPEVEAPLRRG